MTDLHELEAIKRLKYRYMRCLDQKEWKNMRECFVPDATSSYGGGKYAYDGCDAIMEVLESSLGRPTILTVHQVHQPEIELTGESTATGVWSLEDRVIDLQHKITIRGAAFYRDEYVKVDGEWKIKSTGYERIFEEMEARPDEGGPKITANLFGSS